MMKVARAKDFNFTGVVTNTSKGWAERHFIAVTYSKKDNMRSIHITLFFVCLGLGWIVND